MANLAQAPDAWAHSSFALHRGCVEDREFGVTVNAFIFLVRANNNKIQDD